MTCPDPNDPTPTILQAQRPALIDAIAGRVHREIPDYTAVSLPLVTERYTAIVDAMIASATTYSPAHLTGLLEQVGRQRLAQGYKIDALLTASLIVEEEFKSHLGPALAAHPPYQAATLRRVANLVGTARHVLSRLNLDAVVQRGSGAKGPQAGDRS